MVVAVKTLKDNAGERERLDLIQELQVMKSLEPHPHVVKLLGCCSERGTSIDHYYICVVFKSNRTMKGLIIIVGILAI